MDVKGLDGIIDYLVSVKVQVVRRDIMRRVKQKLIEQRDERADEDLISKSSNRQIVNPGNGGA